MHFIELWEWISELDFADIFFLKNLLLILMLSYISYREFWESREKFKIITIIKLLCIPNPSIYF